jgi:AcrR family transcriptional regulator
MRRDPDRPRQRPHGRDEVVAALLAATRELVARQPYETVTVRQIAARAGVHHSLIYRHFGSKERLLWEAMNEVAWEMASLLRADPRLRDVVPAMHLAILERADWMRSLAQLLMAGSALEGYERSFPTMRGLRMLVERERADSGAAAGAADGPDPAANGPDPAVVVATATAASAGWILIRTFLVQALELEDRDSAELDRQVADLLGQWVADATTEPSGR